MPADMRSRRYTTMRDVAMLAGVSVKTVSRVVNGEPNVSTETVLRVRRAAAELNYEINLYAGALKRVGAQTKTVGLLLESVDNPFSGAIYKGVEDVMRPAGIEILAASLSAESEHAVLVGFIRRRVDGLIVTPELADHGYLTEKPFVGTPIVFVDRPPRLKAFDAVTSSNYEGAALGARHLIERGHRRIAFVSGDRRIATLRERHRGFVDEIRRSKLLCTSSLFVENARNAAEAESAVRELLNSPDPPSAIFAGQNLVTLGAVRALHALGQQLRVALVGFDDMELLDLLTPGVTVVAQDPRRLGAIAAERLLARMRGEHLSVRSIVVPTALIMRGSGEITPQAAQSQVRARQTGAIS